MPGNRYPRLSQSNAFGNAGFPHCGREPIRAIIVFRRKGARHDRTPSKQTHSHKTAARKFTADRPTEPEADSMRKQLPRRKSAAKPSPKRWSQRVTQESDALDLRHDVFKLTDPKKIAASLKRSAAAQFAPQDQRVSIRALDVDVLYQPCRQDAGETAARAIAARQDRVEASFGRIESTRIRFRSARDSRGVDKRFIRSGDFSGGCGIRFAEENAPPYNFARIPIAKPLSTAAETALLPFINGKTTCSINQPHNPPPVPPARWPVFVLSNLPASGLVLSHA